MRENKGITLIALVVTIIILIILSGVSINLVLGDNGIITKAKEAKQRIEIASVTQDVRLELLAEQMDDGNSLTQAQIERVLSKYGTININEDGSIKSLKPTGKEYEIAYEELWEEKIIETYNKTKNVNNPVLLTGMSAIKFTEPTNEAMGEVVKTNSSDAEWYDYESKKWANAETQDGSMWVWIPRYAYKITGTTIDVKFLIGQTDNYYKEDGTIGIAQRQTEVDQTIDTTEDYIVHPAFTDERNINFANGGWREELTGIWVAKFEAGYASGNNNAEVVASNINYSQANVWVASVERPRNEDGTAKGDGSELARNWLDGIYGETTTAIKYPVFQGTTYSMNYINHNDSYNIAKALTDNGNIYGFSNANADSHLMKNSEWGAVAYLSKSAYGQEGTEIKTNNINLNSGSNARTETAGKSGVDSVYVVTGCSSNNTDVANNVVRIENLNATTGNTAATGSKAAAYKWNQLTGQNASTTGTIYGIYDISGGTWERIAAYVANGNGSLKAYGESIAYDEKGNLKTTSTKYTTVYPYSSPESSTIDTASQNNFASNTKIYGDAVRETTSSTAGTSESGWNTSSWNSDYSYFPALSSPFFIRGGSYGSGSGAGAFAFHRCDGNSSYHFGFRAVVVPSV